MKTDVMFSSKSEEWETPIELFNHLNNYFHFTLDPAATHENHLCEKYYTKEEDGLQHSWEGERVFLNPPYGRVIKDWVRKAYVEGGKENTVVVCLLPSRTDTSWWHEYCMHTSQIWFLRGRLKFKNKLVKTLNSAPFPSVIVIFGGRGFKFLITDITSLITTWNYKKRS